MNQHLLAALTGAGLFLSTAAAADDSSATLGAGGLEFTKALNIRMAREDLYISPETVKIRYEFTNDGLIDAESLVAFPLPDINTAEFYDSPIGTVGSDPVNFVDFRVVVDGNSIPVQVEQRAFVGDRDVTDIVKSFGIPLNVTIASDQGLGGLGQKEKLALEGAGLAGASDPEQPKWIVRTRFYWMQKFPAGRTVIVEHSYKPVTGQTFFTSNDLDKNSKSGRAWQQNYCMDRPTLAAIRRKVTKNGNNGELAIYSTEFVLKTANNWKGGIGLLHLTIDKLKPDNVLSLCWDGNLKATSQTRFESTLVNVAPKQDIKFVVLKDMNNN